MNHQQYLKTVLKLQQTIINLQQEIEELKTCKDFGMLNQKGLSGSLETSEKDWIIFIDIDDMKTLNNIFGYKEVNNKIKKLFSIIRNDEIIVGRYFSGDEIVINCHKKDSQIILKKLITTAKNYGLSFTYSERLINQGENVEKVVDELSKNVLEIKQNRKLGLCGII